MAKIFLVEDHDKTRELAQKNLERNGHEVVAQASTLTDALAKVATLSALGVEVAVLDGNLTMTDGSGNDGATIAAAIRELCPGVAILTWSRAKYAWGDAFQLKTADYHALVTAVDSLLNVKPSDPI